MRWKLVTGWVAVLFLCGAQHLSESVSGRDGEGRQQPSLEKALRDAGAQFETIQGLAGSDLQRALSNDVVLKIHDPLNWAIAFYYLDSIIEGKYLPQEFWFAMSQHGEARAQRFSSADFGLQKSTGALLRIHQTRDFAIVGGHWTPSRGPSLVIRIRDLKAMFFVDGRVFQTIAPNSLIYSPGVVHFAPTHPHTVRFIDLEMRHDREIYPLKPAGQLWQRRVRYLTRRYREWGPRLGNHHGNPELFNRYLSRTHYDPASNRLWLHMFFGGSERCGLEYEDGLEDVLVIYRNFSTKPVATEVLLEEALQEYGVKGFDELVEKPEKEPGSGRLN